MKGLILYRFGVQIPGQKIEWCSSRGWAEAMVDRQQYKHDAFGGERYPAPGEIIVDSHTYHVGDSVEVHAHGRWRLGYVTKLGRSKVAVEFISNLQGTSKERTFSSTEVRPKSE